MLYLHHGSDSPTNKITGDYQKGNFAHASRAVCAPSTSVDEDSYLNHSFWASSHSQFGGSLTTAEVSKTQCIASKYSQKIAAS